MLANNYLLGFGRTCRLEDLVTDVFEGINYSYFGFSSSMIVVAAFSYALRCSVGITTGMVVGVTNSF